MTDTDYLIAGAGSAGCVLANRLSADGHTRVTLVEAGAADPERAAEVQVPLLFPRASAMAGTDSGRISCQKILKSDAPSMRAESMSWPGRELM